MDNILVPLDGSIHSMRALEVAIEIAKSFRGKITLIHVYSANIPLYLYMDEEASVASTEMTRLIEATRKASARILADGEKLVKAAVIPVETVLKEGHPVQEILRTAKEGKFDLIVIGAKGLSRLKETLLGSVSEKIVRNSPCHVLVVK